eukprot:COSAG04_NODE_33903_length_124_cov_3585.280000_1_plen_41_part_11
MLHRQRVVRKTLQRIEHAASGAAFDAWVSWTQDIQHMKSLA